MDLLGFSNEDLDSINSHGNTRARVTFEPVIEPMPDLKTFSEEAKQKYIQTRQSEIQRLKTRYNNQNTRINQIDKNSQLARVQKFVKKLKSIGDDNGEDLVHELKELNLKKKIRTKKKLCFLPDLNNSPNLFILTWVFVLIVLQIILPSLNRLFLF